MGLTLSSIFSRLFWRKEVRIIMFGLDAVGKTTILYRLKTDDVVTTIPTTGFNVETLEYNNISLSVWDVGGGDKIRVLWHHYMAGCQGVVFVVDSDDWERLDEAKESLYHMIHTIKERDVALLVFANKQDLVTAMSEEEITERMELGNLCKTGVVTSWHIQPSCAVEGRGLHEGFDWLSKELAKK